MIKRSIVVKAVLVLAIFIFILTTIFMWYAYQREKGVYYSNLEIIHAVLQSNIELESETIQYTKDQLQRDNQAYQTDAKIKRLQEHFDKMIEARLVENTYLFYPELVEKNGKTYARFMMLDSVTAQALPPFSEYELNQQYHQAFIDMKKNGVGISQPFEDDLGSWLTVIRPLHNDQGEIMAYFAVDYDYTSVQKDLRDMLRESALIGLIVAVISIVILGFLLRYALRSVMEMTDLTLKAAQGDLSVQLEIRSEDEFGRLATNFNMMIANINNLVENIKLMSKEVTTNAGTLESISEQTVQATNEISGAIQELATGAEVQVQTSEGSNKVMGEMVLGIQQIAESTSTANDYALETSTWAEQGSEVIKETVGQMQTIHGSISETVQVIRVLEQHSQEIGQIIKSIGDIAQQTNLLALNAGIEAARAGENGRGFAVVATEIRKLSEQAKEATSQISQLIQYVQEDTVRVVEAMVIGAKEVDAGTEIVHKADTTFQRIYQAVHHVTEQIQEVSAAAEQMLANSEEVSATLNELTTIAQASAANTQSVAASSEEQLASMEELTHSVHVLREMAERVQQEAAIFTTKTTL